MRNTIISATCEFYRRLTAASAAQRYLRIMPAVCCLVTLFYVMLALDAHKTMLHIWSGWILMTAPLLFWCHVIGKFNRVRGGQPIGRVFMPWPVEWAAGLCGTAVVVSFVQFTFTPHVHHHHVLTARLAMVSLVGVAGLIGLAFCLFYWWACIVLDLRRPSSSNA